MVDYIVFGKVSFLLSIFLIVGLFMIWLMVRLSVKIIYIIVIFYLMKLLLCRVKVMLLNRVIIMNVMSCIFFIFLYIV